MSESDQVAVVMVMVVLVVIFGYFLPTVIAFMRGHHQRLAILVLNLFLGWTFLGWILSLVWACTAVRHEATADG